MTARDVQDGTLADAIVRLRREVGSQAKLARKVGATERTVKRWEAGAVPQRKFRPALTSLGVDPQLFESAELREEIEKRLRRAEGEIARIRALLV